MKSNNWNRVETLFTEALDLEGESREAFLKQACQGDRVLYNEIVSLIIAYETDPEFMETPAFHYGTVADSNIKDPEQIGPYRIIRKIAAGGMGVVYEAEQPDPCRRVALKVIHGDRATDEQRIRLFQREVRTLARLRHPSIAVIYDAGCAEDGRHFYAMELVEGEKLTDYVLRHNLSHRERLKLFAKVCEAISYAHQRGVIHRDLKPSNILVMEKGSDVATLPESKKEDEADNARGQSSETEVKVLDFGLAQFISGLDTPTTIITETGHIMGTLSYMSPEQSKGKRDEIDVRSDVYTLGVILFELMTDRLPHPIQGLPPYEGIRILCEELPPKPSSIRGALKGDMESVILKALEKEAGRRYQSVAALGEDIDRYLNGLPTLAHPPSTSYQLKRLIKRHKLPFAFATALLVMLIGFGTWMTLLYLRTLEAERNAEMRLEEVTLAKEQALEREREAKKQQTMALEYGDLLRYLISSVDPNYGEGHEVKVKDILDHGVDLVESKEFEYPEVKASIQDTLGWSYLNLFMIDEAEAMLESALEIRKNLFGEMNDDTIHTMANLGHLNTHKGDFKEAERIYQHLVDLEFRMDPKDPSRAVTMCNLAFAKMHLGKLDETEAVLNEVLEIRRQHFGEDHIETITTFNMLGVLVSQQSRWEEAGEFYLKALEGQRRALGNNDILVATTLCNLATVKMSQGDYSKAEQYLRECLEIAKATRGEKSPEYAMALKHLGRTLTNLNRNDEAESVARKALELNLEVYEEGHVEVALSQYDLGFLLTRIGQYEEAEKLFLAAIEVLRLRCGNSNIRTIACLENLAALYTVTGREEEAETLRKEIESSSGNPPQTN